MKTWKKILLPISIFVIGSMAVVAVVSSKPEPMPKADQEPPAKIKVRTAQAEIKTVNLSVSSQGTVTPKSEIDLVSQVSGVVTHVETLFVSGQFFDKSQILLKIDDSDYQVALLNAKSRLADAQRRLAEEEGLTRQAKREWRDLGSESANKLFLRKPQLAAAKASIASANADLEKAKLDLKRTEIRVPFAGRIKETFVNVGQFVNMGSRLARVYDTSAVEVRLPLTDKQASKINLPFIHNDAASSKVKPALVLIKGVVAGRPHQWSGSLTRSDAFVDINSRMYYAIAEVKGPFNDPIPLLPGLFVEAEIESNTSTEIIAIPESAIFKRDQIYIIDADNKVQQRTVSILKKGDGEAWLKTDFASPPIVALEKQSLVSPKTEIEPIL